MTTGVLVDLEALTVGWELDTGLLVDTVADVHKVRSEESQIQVRRTRQREIEILREPIGLEEAFLQAGPALEGPFVSEGLVS